MRLATVICCLVAITVTSASASIVVGTTGAPTKPPTPPTTREQPPPATTKALPLTTAPPATTKALPPTTAPPATTKALPPTTASPATTKALPPTTASPPTPPPTSSCKVITIYPSDPQGYLKIEAAGPCDTVLIAPGTYAYLVYLTARGTASRPINITALDPTRPPVWDAGKGTYIDNLPGSYTGADRGRGFWQMVGAANIELSYIVIQNAHQSTFQGAGIRYYNSVGIYVHHAKFLQSDNGVTGGNMHSEGRFEHCEFAYDGTTLSTAPSHNLYIYGGTFTLRYSYSHDGVTGQNFHLRCAVCVVEYNWFERAASYAGDLMPSDDGDITQTLSMTGNVIVQGTTQQNTNQLIAVYNDVGTKGWSPTVSLQYNTIVAQPKTIILHVANSDPANGMFNFFLVSNALIGPVVIIDLQSKSTIQSFTNFVPTLFDTTLLRQSVTAMSAGLDANQRPTSSSPLIGAAAKLLPFPFTLPKPTAQYGSSSSQSTCCTTALRTDSGVTIGAFQAPPKGPVALAAYVQQGGNGEAAAGTPSQSPPVGAALVAGGIFVAVALAAVAVFVARRRAPALPSAGNSETMLSAGAP